MTVLFAFMGGWFYMDWKVGYPKKNEVFYAHESFKVARVEFKARETAGQSGADWEAFAGGQSMDYPEEPGLLPAGVDLAGVWPDVLVNYEDYKAAYEKALNGKVAPAWLDYSHAQGWGSEAPDGAKDKGTIQEQLYMGMGAGVLALVAGYFLLRNGRRSMRVDEEAYYAPGGERIPYGQIRRIDTRKWGPKGLAYLYYEAEGGAEKKTKVDGMVYGQFKEEEGEPAEQLYRKILKNFSGELIELEAGDEEDEEESGPEESKD